MHLVDLFNTEIFGRPLSTRAAMTWEHSGELSRQDNSRIGNWKRNPDGLRSSQAIVAQ